MGVNSTGDCEHGIRAALSADTTLRRPNKLSLQRNERPIVTTTSPSPQTWMPAFNLQLNFL